MPARLTLIGAEPEDVQRYVPDPATEARIEALGRVSGDELWHRLHEADVLCAPSLSGESFGMVLTEAFAAGTPVIASEIAGYSDVVTDGSDGDPGAPGGSAAARRGAAADVPRARTPRGDGPGGSRNGAGATRGRGSPSGSSRSTRRLARPPSRDRAARSPGRAGLAPIDGGPRRPPKRLPSLDPAPAQAAARHRVARRHRPRRRGRARASASRRSQRRRSGSRTWSASIVRSDAGWVLIATGLMMAAMLMRAVSWFAIARAALPRSPLRRRDVTSATMIGVLMSATLPARLGEPARAMVLARRTGRMRETFPVLLGTLVSQTALNIVALWRCWA